VPGSIWQIYFGDTGCHLFFWLWRKRGTGGFINFLLQKGGLLERGDYLAMFLSLKSFVCEALSNVKNPQTKKYKFTYIAS